MKKILFNLMICAGLVVLASCEKKVTTEDTSTVTHYVSFELNEGGTTLVPLNGTYTDPGVVATENGKDVQEKVSVTITDPFGDPVPSVDATALGMFNVYYSASNVDGFAASAKRVVVVYDPAARTDVDLAGNYVTAAGTHRQTATAKTDFDGYKVSIANIGNGVFYVSDILGGYYAQRAGYGVNYSMPGYISVNADYTLTIISASVAGWGDSYDDFSGTYDPATGAITYCCVYAGMDFNVIL